MNIKKNIIVEGSFGRPILFDLFYNQNKKAKALIIFLHGFKGFKDWGIWDLMAHQFVKNGFAFLKMNFAFNGTSPEHPSDFDDLEAFGLNNYSKELADIDTVLNYLFNTLSSEIKDNLNLNNIVLVGHSRGGGIGIIKANMDDRIKALVTWAAVSDLAYSMRDEILLKQWKNDGVYYILNGRTKQQMPLYYQLYEDYFSNQDLLNIEKTMKTFSKPCLIVHGTADPAVPLSAAKNLNEWCKDSQLEIIENANHVFGGSHPFKKKKLPEHANLLLEKTLRFLKEDLV